MPNLFLTLVIAFVVIVFAIALLATGWLIKGKTKVAKPNQNSMANVKEEDSQPQPLLKTKEAMTMYSRSSPTSIQSLFNSIAKRYDRTNAIFLFAHQAMEPALIQSLLQRNQSCNVFLDLCAGTGDITFEYLRQQKASSHVYLVDFSSEMLACAQQKERRLSPQSFASTRIHRSGCPAAPFS